MAIKLTNVNLFACFISFYIFVSPLTVHLCCKLEPTLHGAQEYRWVQPDELANYAFPAGHRNLLAHLKKNAAFFCI
jgi:hypothetical protein